MITVAHCVALWAFLGQPEGESAEPSPVSVVVLPPDASGLPADRRALVLDTVLAQLPEANVKVVERSTTAEAMSGLQPDCGAVATCRSEVASRSDAQFVVRAVVTEPRSSDYAIVLELYEVGVDEAIASFDDACTICSEADLERIVRERTLDLRQALLRRLTPEEPVVAPPPVEAVLAPVVVVTPGKTEVLPPSRLRLAGWGLIGAGAAGTLGGIVLLALQGSAAGCPADPRGGQCIPLVYRTAIPGAVTTGVGIAALGAGVALVIVGKRRDASKASARLVPTGAGLRVTGRF